MRTEPYNVPYLLERIEIRKKYQVYLEMAEWLDGYASRGPANKALEFKLHDVARLLRRVWEEKVAPDGEAFSYEINDVDEEDE